jgi:hypothetical protein
MKWPDIPEVIGDAILDYDMATGSDMIEDLLTYWKQS